MAKYKWAEGARCKSVSASTMGQTIERIRIAGGGKLKAEALVEEARPPDSPIHGAFEWDDSVAAEAHRRQQARQYICSLVTIIPQAEKLGPMRAFVSVKHDEKRPQYTSISVALGDSELRAQLVQQALEEAESWADRYKRYRELAMIVTAIKRTKRKRGKG